MSQHNPVPSANPATPWYETAGVIPPQNIGRGAGVAPRQAMTALDIASLVIGTLGALNWGASGAANFNLVRRLFGRGSLLERMVYIVVGLAGLNLAWLTARYLISGGQTPLGPLSGRVASEMQHRTVTQPPMTPPGTGVQQNIPRPGMGPQSGMMR